jgi:hypothetical protein
MKPATEIIYWPGQRVPACEDHAEKLKKLGIFMGFAVSSTPCQDDEICTNCATEERKRAAGKTPEGRT